MIRKYIIVERENEKKKKKKKKNNQNFYIFKVLITSNDSRIRLYDIRTKEIERKYRGYSNQSSQIRASFSYDDRYIIRYNFMFVYFLELCFFFFFH